MVDTIYEHTVKFKGRFDVAKLYSTIHKTLKKQKWKDTQFGDHGYEKYYYEKLTRDGKKFYNIVWEAQRTFFDGKPSIKHYLKLEISVSAYDIKTQVGSLKIKIKGEQEIGELEDIKPSGFWETFLATFPLIRIPLGKMKSAYLDTHFKRYKKESPKKLYKDCDSIRKEILKFLQGYVP